VRRLSPLPNSASACAVVVFTNGELS
jgi:hypothetical protein